MRDEKVLKKLATHDMQDVSNLFSIVDKCARAVEGRAWHSQPAPEARKAGKPDADIIAQSSVKNNNNNKKKADGNKPLAGAPTAAVVVAAAGGGCGPHGDKRSRYPSDSDEGGLRCPVHNSKCQSAEECQEMKKLVRQFCEQ
jgi:hypothetical protein